MATAKSQSIIIQVDDEVREATAEEISELQLAATEVLAAQTAQEAKAAARQSALAKLAELGLTEEEIQAL